MTNCRTCSYIHTLASHASGVCRIRPTSLASLPASAPSTDQLLDVLLRRKRSFESPVLHIGPVPHIGRFGSDVVAFQVLTFHCGRKR